MSALLNLGPLLVIAAILLSLAGYGFRKRKLPLRQGGFVEESKEPTRFRFWLFCFLGGAAVCMFALIAQVAELAKR